MQGFPAPVQQKEGGYLSIDLYSGTPGSGKSYRAVCEVLSWLKRGKNVIANFPVNLSYFGKKKIGHFEFIRNTDLTVDYLLSFAQEHHHHGLDAQTLVVVDEAAIIFNCRQWDKSNHQEWLNFFANHRHFNFSFILISQDERMLDRQIRGLIESEFKHRSMRNYKTFGWILSMLCGGLFMQVEYWHPCRLKSNAVMFRINRKKANCYDTMALFNLKDDGEEGKADDSNQKDVEQPGSEALSQASG